MYNYQGKWYGDLCQHSTKANACEAPSQYGRPPGYGGVPGQAGGPPPGMLPPPGMGMSVEALFLNSYAETSLVPPGMAAPGIAAPPGMQAQGPPGGRAGGLPPNFQPPAGMPNINFSAPVIRLGTSGPSKGPSMGDGMNGRKDSHSESFGGGGGARRGLGMGGDYRSGDMQRQQMRENMMVLQPPTREEIARTIFVGGIVEGLSDDALEQIFRTAGSLRRWIRVTDADNKPCKFGFAEYEDAESLGTACELFKDLQVPLQKRDHKETEPDANGEVQKVNIMVREPYASVI